ncbi:Stk1 family PASTA domain-containing Ser/Thr kinase [Isoptericola sp. NEAU-Y5]|uniref:non-specific serine/threonine protein kinase n=1 Tax=Isoptericola luteus TaxID=2879484 RepID=A0ABS7ZJ82_9MICO|nr:Stk1 family PASTA domain-containing Ser/Thr kinase [Isoptericola sp. NEAU-Y5]MCA5893869.1 Stk1 family PASTA domain-containing Ser/Thr kinase [Isoptericola sp. NEAU-Y5]
MTTTDPLLGRLVDGRYEIAARVARGGMATVYRAQDRRLDREVAIKVMHPHLADGVDGAAFVSRFRREARAAARLTHPGVVAVYDQGLDGETSYLVMEYVPGTNLRRELHEDGALTVRRALDVLAQVLAALAAAHRKQLVHRDIKPENVLVTHDGDGEHGPDDRPRGRVKVADFGLARAVTEVTSTATGTILGTVAYLAPEVITSGECDARTDIYAVGVLAYEMLTGELPHAGEPPIQVAFHHVHEDYPVPSARVDWLPAGLDALVASCTARDRTARPADAGAALTLVERLRESLPDDVLDRRAEPSTTQGTAVEGRGDEPGAGADPDELVSDPDPFDAIPTAFFQEVSAPAQQETDLLVDHPTQAWDAAAGPRPGRRRHVVAWALAAVLLLGGGGLGTWWWFADGPGAWIDVPAGVAGVPLDDAVTTLEAAGLRTTSSKAYDDHVPAGSVVTTDPAPGEPVRTDGTVDVVVSRGVEMVAVPRDLVGAEGGDARAALQEAGLTVGPAEKAYDDEAKPGTVVEVSVPEGSVQRHDTEVVLTVSDGPAPVQVPQVVGKKESEAVDDLEALGLEVTTADPEYSEDVPEGHVMKQEPEHGTTAHRTDTLTLTVSQGPPLVEVPDVVGMSTAKARKALEKAGFEVDENVYLGGILDKVRFQDVTGEAPKGSTVTVTIW